MRTTIAISIVLLFGFFVAASSLADLPYSPKDSPSQLPDSARKQPPRQSRMDRQLAEMLEGAGFTGRIESTFEARLGRPLDERLADLGRLVFFDPIEGLHGDNSCAGCHSPRAGFGDSQSMAIGVDNNGLVGPDRAGPRNQRRAPQVINSAFFPRLMLNGRFVALSGDPFDNSEGFQFPPPEGTTKFPPLDPEIRTLLAAQGHIPQTELVEMAGFTGTAGTIGPEFDAFDDGHGSSLPPPDASGFRNEPIRGAVLARFNHSPEYLARFGEIFNGGAPLASGDITFAMVGRAIAEFQMSLTFADAPIDRFARGDAHAMSVQQKRGALLFFGEARCVQCHAVADGSNEMFSDFQNHVLGVPQIAPVFGVGTGNVIFDGPGRNEDFGAEQISGNPADRYAFRTTPLRNMAVQPAFFHNGCLLSLADAIRHHLDVVASVENYDPVVAGVDPDLTHRRGPMGPVLTRLDPLVAQPLDLDNGQFEDLLVFVRDGLLDPRALPENLCALVPETVPSGLPVAEFQGCGDSGLSPSASRRTSLGPVLGVWPNPAPVGGMVHFTLVDDAPVELAVFDVAGRRIRGLVSGTLSLGPHSVQWDGRDDAGRAVASGVYLIHLDHPKGMTTERLILIR